MKQDKLVPVQQPANIVRHKIPIFFFCVGELGTRRELVSLEGSSDLIRATLLAVTVHYETPHHCMPPTRPATTPLLPEGPALLPAGGSSSSQTCHTRNIHKFPNFNRSSNALQALRAASFGGRTIRSN